jgi:RNA polymerase sigma-70 factor (ECF subfamily)
MRALSRGVARETPGRARPEEALAHADALYHLAHYLTHHPGDAEELVQETYARALGAWDRFTPGTNMKAWLFRILRNAFVTHYRHERRGPPLEPYDTVESASAAAADRAGPPGDQEAEAMRHQASAEIGKALRSLPEEARLAILLDLEDFTESEMASTMGCSVGTVKSRLHRARAALRARLAAHAGMVRP